MTSLPTFGTSTYPAVVPGSQQVVIPQITFPTQSSITQGHQLMKVKGLDGAKRFTTQPNSMYALFDEDDDILYVKVTDGNNYPVSLKRYRFVEEAEPEPPKEKEYVTMDRFEEFENKVMEALSNAKQPIRNEYNNPNKQRSDK